MFKLYCLPGKILTHIHWLFPDRMADVAGTHRRKNSRFVHFLYSTVIYVILAALLLFVSQIPSSRKGSKMVSASNIEAQTDLVTTTGEAIKPALKKSKEPEPEPEPFYTEASAQPAFNDTHQTVPPIAPESSPHLSQAIQDAIAQGAPIRWNDGNYAGYVVVSDVQAQTGCRSMYYSIDTSGKEWRSENSIICP